MMDEQLNIASLYFFFFSNYQVGTLEHGYGRHFISKLPQS